jgi:hypothetical protein
LSSSMAKQADRVLFALLLPDLLVAAVARQAASDGTASVDLGVDAAAVWGVHDQHALRIHRPFGGAALGGELPHHAASDR